MFWTMSSLNLLGAWPFAQRGQAAFLGVGQRLVAGDDHFLEDLVLLDHLFHFLLDFRKILRRDAVREFHVVIKSVLHRRAGGELGVGPELGDGRGQDVRAGMSNALQVRHFLPFFRRFAFVFHSSN